MVDARLEGDDRRFEGVFGGEDEEELELAALGCGGLAVWACKCRCNGEEGNSLVCESWEESENVRRRECLLGRLE